MWVTSKSESLQRLLTVNEVAHLLHVHPCTVRRWEKQGLLRSIRLGPKRCIRLSKEDVAEFINLANKLNGGIK